MRTIAYQIDHNKEAETFDLYEFETRHAVTGDEHEFHYIASFPSRHLAMAAREQLIGEPSE